MDNDDIQLLSALQELVAYVFDESRAREEEIAAPFSKTAENVGHVIGRHPV